MTKLALGYCAIGAVAFTVPFWLGDSEGLFLAGIALLGAASVLVGALAGRWSALWLAFVVLGSSLVTDLLWAVGAIDRSDEHEPVPLTFALIFWFAWFVPAAALLIALGVAARKGLRRPGPLRGATG